MAEQGIFKEPIFDEDDDEFNFPSVPLALLEELERQFPDKVLDPKLSEPDRLILTGKVLLIRFLREMHQRPSTIRKL
jgi:hypothetical protein